jgi:DNA-binding PadR family transcriptional regulator
MSSVRLSSTSYVVLGLIGLRGPSTPYELKRAVERSGIADFWPFPHSQLYDEPARLATAGLLEEEREQAGRRRRLYRLTEAGQAALKKWVQEPEGGGFQVRDPASLKLFFSELGANTDDIIATARLQEAFHAERLARYEAMEAHYADRPERAHRLAPLHLGVHLTRAAIEFWRSIIEQPPESHAAVTPISASAPHPSEPAP